MHRCSAAAIIYIANRVRALLFRWHEETSHFPGRKIFVFCSISLSLMWQFKCMVRFGSSVVLWPVGGKTPFRFNSRQFELESLHSVIAWLDLWAKVLPCFTFIIFLLGCGAPLSMFSLAEMKVFGVFLCVFVLVSDVIVRVCVGIWVSEWVQVQCAF